MNIDDENDCMNCGMCHDCIVLTMETAHEAQAAKLRAEIAAKDSETERLRAALQAIYDETADYIRINNLGDVHHNTSMKMARDALAKSTGGCDDT